MMISILPILQMNSPIKLYIARITLHLDGRRLISFVMSQDFVKGAIGATIGLDVGLIAGGAGANKVILTCMNCGHQWKPGKK